jgi:hypothetical protein
MSTITTYRGDTTPVQRTIKIGGVATDITGWSFVLTVNWEANPTDTTNQIGTVAGTITDAPGGEVEFEPTEDMTATVGTFYYDIQITDANGKISTKRGQWVVLQDITKALSNFWQPDEGTYFDPYPIDGSGGFLAINRHANDSWAYNVPPGPLPISGLWVSLSCDASDSEEPRVFLPTEDLMPIYYREPGWQWSIRYLVENESRVDFVLAHGDAWSMGAYFEPPPPRGSASWGVYITELDANGVPSTTEDSFEDPFWASGDAICLHVRWTGTEIQAAALPYFPPFAYGEVELRCDQVLDEPEEPGDWEIARLSVTPPAEVLPLTPAYWFTPTSDGEIFSITAIRSGLYSGS